ncbi:MAG: HlyD family efflux transporter periplasmic adaptor subunit [Bacteroidota bacterium]
MVKRHQNSEELSLRSEEIQEILTNPPSWLVSWGITLIFLFTIIVLTLSIIIKYPDFVIAKVLVTTQKPTEKIVARTSGALSNIYIHNGDSVGVRERLAVIRNTANTDDVYLLKSILDTLSLESNSLNYVFPETSNLVLGDIERAYINFEKSYIDYNLLKELDPYTNELYGSQKSLAEIKLRLKNQIEQKDILEQEHRLKKNEFERHNELFKKGVISQQEFESKKLEFLQMEKNISAMAISISQIRESISSTGHALKDTKINQREDDTRFLTNLSQSYNSLKRAINDWEHKYVLWSSIDGIVSFQEFWGINQFINSGEVVFSVLPTDRSSLVGKLTIPSQNAGKVTLGQKTLIKLDNFPYQQFGTLTGRVKNISISPDKEGNYFVYIFLPNGTMTSYNRELPFDQELIGNAEIITEDLSVAQRIFYKFRNLFDY